MTEISADYPALKPLTIRYDGLDADRHVIEITDLAESLRGLGRVIGIAATFATTEKFSQHADARPVKVVVGPPRDNCVSFEATFFWVEQHPFIAGTASALTATLVAYIFKYFAGRAEEMKHLRAVTEEAIRQLGSKDDKVITRLLDTVDKMAVALRPAVRSAVKPIGRTASTLSIGSPALPATIAVIDKAQKDSIDAEAPQEVGDEQLVEVVFVEMNLDTKACRLTLTGTPDERVAGEITDPELLVPNNAYATAFAAQTPLCVRAKPTCRDGSIERWYISGYAA